MPVVNIPNIGAVTFPDTMSPADITNAIENDILKQNKPVELPKPTAGETFESNLLSPLMGLSRLMGGVSPEAHSQAVKIAEEGAKENEIAGMAGKLTGMIGPAVPLMAAAPVLAPAAGLGGMGAGVAIGAATAPQVGGMAGADRYQSLLNAGAPEDEARRAAITEGAITGLSNMIPVKGNLLGRMAKGAGINVGTGVGSRAIQNKQLTDENYHQDITDPKAIALDAILGGVFEGVGGSRLGERMLSKNELPTATAHAQERLAGERTNAVGNVELTILQDTYRREVNKLTKAQDGLSVIEREIVENGDASAETVKAYQEAEARVKQAQENVDSLKKIFENPEALTETQRADTKALADQEAQRVKEQLIKERGEKKSILSYPTQDKFVPPERVSDTDTRLMQEQQGFTEEAPPAPPVKQSPAEVALTKIGQATNNPVVAKRYLTELQEKIAEAQQRPDSVGPGGEYNSKLQAMMQEEKAYRDIIAGKQPDLSWFDNTSKTNVEAPPVRQNVEPDMQPLTLDDHASIDSALRANTFDERPVAGIEHTEIAPPTHLYGDDIARTQIDRTPVDVTWNDGTMSPKQYNQQLKYQQTGLEQKLDTINQAIKNYEEGKTPAGTVDVADLYKKRENLENWINSIQSRREQVLKTLPAEREQAIRDGDPAGYKAEEQIVINPPKYDSVKDILTSGERDLPHLFDNNKQLFDTVDGTNIFFDKSINKLQQKVISYFVEKLGLNKEKIYFVTHEKIDGPLGNCELFGNTAVIRMNTDRMSKRVNAVNSGSKVWSTFLGAKMDTASRAYFHVRVAAHELGHLFLNKMLKTMTINSGKVKVPFNELPLIKKLQESFDSMTTKASPVVPYDITKNMDVVSRQKYFHEFFAEQVAKELLYKHTLGAFTSRSEFGRKFSHLIEISKVYLAKHKVNIDESNFAREIVNDLIEENKQTIEKTGKTVFENFEMRHMEKQVFSGMDMETMDRKYVHPNTDWHKPRQGTGDDLNLDIPKQFSLKAITALVSKAFGRTQIAQIFRDNPHIAKTYSYIREAETRASRAAKHVWFGQESKQSFDNKSIFTRFSDIKDGNSPYHTIKQTTDLEMYNLHQLFKKGFEEELDYAETLAKYGNHLTEKERKGFETLSQMFRKQYRSIVGLQIELDKKHILQERKGWYPSERQGDYFVTFSFGNELTHRQHFATETAAKAFIDSVNKEGFKHLTVSGVMKKSAEDILDAMGTQGNLIDTVLNMIKQKYPRAGQQIMKDVEKLQKLMAERGGKAGMHHEERSNIGGYRGSELFQSDKELGRNFKEAIIKSVDSYSGAVRNIYLKTKITPILEDIKIDADSKMLVQQMFDSSLNRNRNWMEKPDSFLRESVEKTTKMVMETFGKEYKGKHAALDTIVGNSLELLYLTKIMAKGAFILSQPMSSLQAIRHMSYTGDLIRPWYSYGKGLFNLVSGNKELKSAMYQTKLTSNTFEPQFIDSLHLTEHSGPIMTAIKDWAMLRKPAEVADTLSRAFTYSAMFTHYRDKGHSFEEAVKLAEHGTDATMITYGARDTAPMFQHAGFTGAMVRPLQTFPTAALGNFIADLKHINPKKLSTLAPMINYGLSTIALSGVMGLQFISEYEAIRKWMQQSNPDSGLPAIADIMQIDPDFEDRIQPDPTAIQQAMLLGIPATVSGVDLASSLRSNETFATTLVGIASGQKSVLDALPLTGLASDMISGFSTLGKDIAVRKLGIEGHDLSVHDKADAISKAFPAGAWSYAAKEAAGVNEAKAYGSNTGMMIGGKEGDATTERTTTDKVAGYLGTKSTNDRTNLIINMRKQELLKERNEAIKKNVNLFTETGKAIYLDRLSKLDVTDKQLQNTLENSAYKKFVDQRLRFIANKQGKVNEQKAGLAVRYGDFPE